MATEKTSAKPKAFIDYGADSDAEIPKRYTADQLLDYWGKALVKYHRCSAASITIKEKSLASKLITSFGPEMAVKLIDRWMKSHHINEARSFGFFYKNRYHLYDQVTPKDYGWE